MAKSHRGVTVLGFLGTTLDGGFGPARFDRWRPTVAVCQQDDLVVKRLVLFVTESRRRHDANPRSRDLAQTIVADIASVSPHTRVDLVSLPVKDPWDFEEVYSRLLDFAKAFEFDPEREDYLVHLTTGTHVAQICLFLLAESRRIPARLLQTSPRQGEANSPVGSHQIIDLDLGRYDSIATRFAAESRDAVSFLKSGIATRNTAFNRQIERIEQVALASREPILLMGPTGAGKSRIASRAAELKLQRHHLKGRAVEVNCATIRGDGAMSTLFGHVKGAFTGAQSARSGLLKSADGGVLFLDEIGELGLDEQAMLLRAIEEKRFLPVGSDREEKSDFQLLAGTNSDLRAAVRSGRFREDLLARIDIWTFHLPGLKDRREDIEPNLEWELDRLAQSTGKHVRFSTEAREAYLAFATSADARWHGNFRELNASLMRLSTLALAGRITEGLVSEEIERLHAGWRRGRESADAASDAHILDDVFPAGTAHLDRFDAVQLAEVVRVCRAARSLSDAGRALFAASRALKSAPNDADRLRKYLARFGLTFERLRPVPA